ncbi:muramoyltetrapeptide carboxypeptidase [Tumebacillus algifaecis]|uniref:Muramoyltetrapeptide carboxypeptidase n=2 Tax=Tumebacillus algifaecis TaxID=1214604 RepID=A0A223D679_9BACL|nr:muramoyltetrapeptide carboxypeptidase [Tumebacillus algifaecis]
MTKVAAVMLAMAVVFPIIGQDQASAYSWTRNLQEGSNGADVKELQIRVAGWAADSASRTFVEVDGIFGAGTKAAVKRFQSAYGLTADGIVGPATQAKLNSLEAGDGSTQNFNFSEFYSGDGKGFNGGKVGAATVKENVRRMMYKLEAVRKKAGNTPVQVNSGFRSLQDNAAAGGVANSQHMYGIAADIVLGGYSPTSIANIAKRSGFSGVIIYSTFTHVDSCAEYPYGMQGTWYWP